MLLIDSRPNHCVSKIQQQTEDKPVLSYLTTGHSTDPTKLISQWDKGEREPVDLGFIRVRSKMSGPRLELRTYCAHMRVLDSCDNQLHHPPGSFVVRFHML